MKFQRCWFNTSSDAAQEISEIESVIASVPWTDSFQFQAAGKTYRHQSAYNKAFASELAAKGWTMQPRLSSNPALIADAGKNGVFVEVQFGNSATLYRDYFKFQYGLIKRVLRLAVLIVPVKATQFFPTRVASVNNMAEYELAHQHFTILPGNAPTLLIGLLSQN